MRFFFKRNGCRSGIGNTPGGYIPEVLCLTISDGVRTWTEYIRPVKLASNALVDVETLSGVRKTVNTSFVVCVERMAVVVNRENVSDWDCYKGRKGPVYKDIWYAVPLGWNWDDFESRTDSSEVGRHIIKAEVVFGD